MLRCRLCVQTCNGVSSACPPDALAPAGTTCGTVLGNCEVAATCLGTSPACPGSTWQPAGVLCRPADGPCDIAVRRRLCTCLRCCRHCCMHCCMHQTKPSSLHSCMRCLLTCRRCARAKARCVPWTCARPTAHLPARQLGCRHASTHCQVRQQLVRAKQLCASVTAACSLRNLPACTPAAGTWAPGGCTTTAAGFCQPVVGTEYFCLYSYLPATTQCRPAAGFCDVAEFCTSTSAACPPDASKPNCPPTCATAGLPACVDASSGVLGCKQLRCFHAASVCTAGPTAPLLHPSCITAVRTLPAAGTWVVPPTVCTTGSSTFCSPVPGTDFTCRYAYMPASTVCRAAVGTCDLAETCTGSAASCPADIKRSNCPPTCPTTGLPDCVVATSGDAHSTVLPCLAVLKGFCVAAFTNPSMLLACRPVGGPSEWDLHHGRNRLLCACAQLVLDVPVRGLAAFSNGMLNSVW